MARLQPMSKAETLRADHLHGSAWNSYEFLAKPSPHFRSCRERNSPWPVVFRDDDKLDQTHVSIRIEPVGLRGELRLWVALATPVWPQGKPDQNGVQVAIMLKLF